MHGFNRRAALTTLAGITLGGALPRRALADTTLLHVGIVPIFEVAPFYAANQLGMMAKEGLATTTEATMTGAVGIPALIGGSYDIVYSNSISVLTAISKGLDLRIILETTRIQSKPPDSGAIVTLKGANLKTGKDFERKTLACNGLSNLQWAVEVEWIRATGGDPAKVTIVELPLASMAEAVKSGRVDGAFMLEPFLTIAQGDPTFETAAFPFSKVFATGAPALWVATGATAAQRPEILRAFVRAYRAGANWVNANSGKDPYLQLVANYTKVERRVIEKMPIFPAEYTFYPRSLAMVNTLMVNTGLLQKPVDLTPHLFT